MATFGYEIVNVLVTDIVPDEKVKSAMNDINAAQREQVAANARGEAEKILVVKKAEAEAESKALQGQGIANQRRAIIEGLQTSVEQFQKAVEGGDLEGSDAAGAGDAILRYTQVDRRKRQDEHAVPVALAGGGERSFGPDTQVDARCERGEAIACGPLRFATVLA
jgi:hypothetical protein